MGARLTGADRDRLLSSPQVLLDSLGTECNSSKIFSRGGHTNLHEYNSEIETIIKMQVVTESLPFSDLVPGALTSPGGGCAPFLSQCSPPRARSTGSSSFTPLLQASPVHRRAVGGQGSRVRAVTQEHCTLRPAGATCPQTGPAL